MCYITVSQRTISNVIPMKLDLVAVNKPFFKDLKIGHHTVPPNLKVHTSVHTTLTKWWLQIQYTSPIQHMVFK
jgi:hypothetical protein